MQNLKKFMLLLVLGFMLLLIGCMGDMRYVQQQPSTNHDLIKNAQKHIIDGLNSYERGNHADTKARFDNALSLLKRADLPPDHKDLEILAIGLPAQYKKYNLSKIYAEVKKAKTKKKGFESARGEDEGRIQVMGEAINVEELMEEVERKKETGESDLDSLAALSEDEYIKKEIVRLMAEFGEADYVIPDVFFQSIKHFIHRYQTKERAFFEKALRRSAKYLPLLKSILAQKKVPEDMAYMALVESGFNPVALSRAKAKGLWQFIRSTGRIYGLRVNRHVDDRNDPIKSTLAARHYFLDLVAIFGSRSFMLAMASYNAGEMRIQRCLKKLDDPFKERSFWSIRNCLRRETQDYVPRIIAAAIIGRNPKRFGFDDPNRVKFDTVILRRPVSLSKIAQITNVSVSTIRELNTDLNGKRRSTPSSVPNFILAIPHGTKHMVENQLSKAYVKRYAVREITESYNNNIKKGQEKIRYRVRRGDTLSGIGKKFGVSYKKIARWNNLKGNTIRPGQRLTIYKRGSRIQTASYTRKATKTGDGVMKYTVKKGDSLSEIGKSFGVSYRSIAEWNNLKGTSIRPGQTLTIYTKKVVASRQPQQAKPGENGNGNGDGELRYTVIEGDSLWEIGKKFGVNYKLIADWNDLSGNRLKPGQVLTIYKGKTASSKEAATVAKKGKHLTRYEVEKGNSLYDIGQLFDVGYRDIMRWNNLRNARIYPGAKLKIYTNNEVKLVLYGVKRGDTLSGISQKHNVKLSDLLSYNGLTPKDTLTPNRTLKIYVVQ
jgi:membrane-bound lytic murein transglycosylase D